MSSARDWWADRITIGWAVRRIWPAEPIRLGPSHCYVIRHPRLSWYMRDPLMLKDSSLDPRNQWGPLDKAYRFSTVDAAEHCVLWQEHDGVIETVELP